MYSRDEIKLLTDKVLNMTKADAVEVFFDGGERAGTRFANSSITVNLVQYDQQLTVNIRHGNKQGSANTHEFDDESLKAMVDEADAAALKARDNPNLPALVKGPQDYVKVDAVVPATADFGPGERAAWVKESVDICTKKGVLGAGYIPKAYQTTCQANSEGLFAYYQYAETGFVLTCRMATGGGSGWAGITGAKDLSQVNIAELTEIAANKALKSQKPRAIEPGRYTTIIEPRPAARLLSTMMGAFNAGGGGGGFGGGGGGGFNFGGIGRPFVVGRRHAEDRPEAVQRQLHAEERYRQPDPAPDADHERRRRRPAGDLDRKRRAEERLLRRQHRAAAEGRAVCGQSEHEPGRRRDRRSRSRTW